jgi:hypothetical protein
VVGKTIRFDAGSATIAGVLEPFVPYPADTEIIANVVTSPPGLPFVTLGRIIKAPKSPDSPTPRPGGARWDSEQRNPGPGTKALAR